MSLDTSSSCISRNDQIEENPSVDIFDIEAVCLSRGRKASKACVSVLGSVRKADKRLSLSSFFFSLVQN